MDEDNLLTEISDANNEQIIQVAINSLPDLQITQIYITPSHLVAAADSTISVVVANQGSESATFFVRIDLDEVNISIEQITLSAWESKIITIPWNNMEAGLHTIKARVDVQFEVIEEDVKFALPPELAAHQVRLMKIATP